MAVSLRSRRITHAASWKAVARGGVFALGASLSPLAAQDLASIAPQYPPAVTHHEGTFNGKKVEYTATVSELVVPNAGGRPSARIVYTAYTADNVDPKTRPVLFFCNGGPIVPSVYLHMMALGPKRVAIPADLKANPSTFQFVDNVYAVLDVADIVTFDPASTGWSRVLDGVRVEEYYTTETDAQQFAAFIDQWLRKNDRRGAPIHLLGESYATIRVPETARLLSRLPEPVLVSGIFLMGQAANQVEITTRTFSIMSPVMGLPSVAATAWYHNKIDRRGRTVFQVMEEAFAFGRDEYLLALFKGDKLDEASRVRIANRLEGFTGIPASYYLANNLRITRPTFQNELFRKEGLKLGSDDARYIGPVSGPSPDGVLSAAATRVFLPYMKDFLKVTRTEEYRGSRLPPSPNVVATGAARGRGRAGGRGAAADPGGGRGGGGGGGWVYSRGSPTPFADFPYPASIGEVFTKNPKLRVVVGSGIYDMKTTTGAAEYLLAQSGWPRSQTRIGYYEGGHMAYSNEAALKQFTDDIRSMVTGFE